MAVTIINTGRARVVINVNDDSFVNLITEESTNLTSAFLTSNPGLITSLGNTAEREQGFIEESSIENWVARLSSASFVQGIGGVTFANPDGLTAAGTSRNISEDWYAVQNYLLYGGDVIVGATANDFADKELACIFSTVDPNFGGSHGTTAMLKTALDDRGYNTVGIFHAGTGGTAVITPGDVAVDGSNASERAKVSFFVQGSKRHLNYKRNTELSGSEGLRTTPLTPDVAGCFVRTDRDFAPFFSPAGLRRGRILDIIKLDHNPSVSEQDTLYNANVNPVVTFPGEGTFLFGDKTGITETSTFSRINISRLFIFLKKTIGRLARRTLFEFNDVETRTNFKLQASAILRGIQANRGISDFRIICDGSNNPPEVIDANVFNADILIKPTKSINFITLTFTNKNEADDLGGQPSQNTGN
jgi:hypothetical protein